MKKSLIALVITSAIATGAIAGDSGYRPALTVPLPGDGGWDYLFADSGARRLYVTHGKQVQVLDLDTQQIVGSIAPVVGAHGIAIAAGIGLGYISNGGNSTVTAFDLKTLKIISAWPSTGK